VDFIDATDYDFLLPRRVKKVLAVVLLVGIAFVSPVQRWWLDQIERHADHITREFIAGIDADDAATSALATTLSR
jgi:hypothetical protein